MGFRRYIKGVAQHQQLDPMHACQDGATLVMNLYGKINKRPGKHLGFAEGWFAQVTTQVRGYRAARKEDEEQIQRTSTNHMAGTPNESTQVNLQAEVIQTNVDADVASNLTNSRMHEVDIGVKNKVRELETDPGQSFANQHVQL